MEWRVVSPELRQRTAVPIGSDLLVRALPQSPNGTGGAKEEKPQPLLARDMDARHQEVLDRKEMTAQCAFCPWTFTGPAGDARAAGKQHRETEHPDVGTRKRGRPKGTPVRPPTRGKQVAPELLAESEARRAIHERAEQRGTE